MFLKSNSDVAVIYPQNHPPLDPLQTGKYIYRETSMVPQVQASTNFGLGWFKNTQIFFPEPSANSKIF